MTCPGFLIMILLALEKGVSARLQRSWSWTGFVFYLGLEQEHCQLVQGGSHCRRRSNKKPVRGSSLIAE